MVPTCYPRGMRALVALGLAVILASPLVAASRVPPAELLGLTLGMPDHDVRTRLGRLGKPSATQPDAGGRKQIWQLRHRRYETANLRFNPAFELQWCTLYARRGRLRYTELGDTTTARKVGRFIWVWNVPASATGAAYQVTARGTDPVFASSVALSQPLTRPEGAEPPEAPADSLR